jgi:PAS domain S-box
MGSPLEPIEKTKKAEFFSFWRLQNKITFLSLIAILIVSTLFALASIFHPDMGTAPFIAFIVLVPTIACFGIATCHSSNLESKKVQAELKKLTVRLEATQDSQITLDRFFSISSDLMAVAGKDGMLKKVSTSLVNSLGYSEEKLLSTPFFEFIHPDDRSSTTKNIEALNLGIRSVGFENRYRGADGNYRTLNWSAAADLELGVRFASARDVTHERNMQMRTQQIIDAASFMLMVKDIDGTITECNAAFANTYGVPRASLIGQKVKAVLSAASLGYYREKEIEVIESRRPLTFEEVFLHNGKEVRLLATIFPIFDQSGKITSTGKISIDLNSISNN